MRGEEITTIFDPRRTAGAGPSSSSGGRPAPPSVVIVTAPDSGGDVVANGPSSPQAPAPGQLHPPPAPAPPSCNSPHNLGCESHGQQVSTGQGQDGGGRRRASAMQSLRNFRKSCCSRSARKMYCGVCVTVCVTASWVGATHSIKYLYHVGPSEPLPELRVDPLGGDVGGVVPAPPTGGDPSTRLLLPNPNKVPPAYDAPFLTTWFCTNWTILFFPIYAIGHFLASPCHSKKSAQQEEQAETSSGPSQVPPPKRSRCWRSCCSCCCCCLCCRRRRRRRDGGGGDGGEAGGGGGVDRGGGAASSDADTSSSSSSSASSSSEDEGNGGSSSSRGSSPERGEGGRKRKKRRRRATVPPSLAPSSPAVASPQPPPPSRSTSCCNWCACRKERKAHHHHHHHHHHKAGGRQCCDLLGDTMQRFRDKGFTPARFLTRCCLFCLLWVGYNYMYVHSLRILFSTDAMALYATHACCVYLLSWVLLHHQFVGVRIVAVITVDTGIALLAYMDGITGSPTLGCVLLAACAAAGSAVYKVLFKKVMGEASMGQVALFFSIVGLLNALLLWPLLLALYLLGAETFHWNHLPWLELLLAGSLSLLANLFSSFSVAVTYDLFITLGYITAVPVSAALDVVLYGAHFAGMKLAGIVLISVGFFLVMFPDNWPDYITRLLRWSRRQRHGATVGQRRDVIDYRTGYIRSHLRSPSGRVR
ncbi:putative thiamine transporter SLC35F3 isoform X2 [Ischnura elegans]|uniref:putative thiamine transporter SLC35F3 isoform X2 n=1 Tax=Ischnura elegans TaxID=197161 RepID=UPI001ED87E4C|nr:putative thiamine transporter SLC35F3 isoform X2 [Ischnura elegans]